MLNDVSFGAATPVYSPISLRRWLPWVTAAKLLSRGTSSRVRPSVKFILRALGRPRLTHAWLARLVQPDIAALWAAHPRLATKLQRPYVSCEWSALERVGALLGHYDALVSIFSPSARAAIYREGLVLMRLVNAKSGRRVEIQLCYHDQFEKEGELSLMVHDVASGLTLAGLTFCVARNGGRRIVIIGGFQASPDPRMRELIHDTAKEWHGLRPKAFAL